MGSMLKDILDAEKKAKKNTEQAEKYKTDTMAFIDNEKKKIMAGRIEQAENEIAKEKELHHKSVEQSLVSAEKTNSESIEKLKKLSSENFTKWVDEIYARVVSDL